MNRTSNVFGGSIIECNFFPFEVLQKLSEKVYNGKHPNTLVRFSKMYGWQMFQVSNGDLFSYFHLNTRLNLVRRLGVFLQKQIENRTKESSFRMVGPMT